MTGGTLGLLCTSVPNGAAEGLNVKVLLVKRARESLFRRPIIYS